MRARRIDALSAQCRSSSDHEQPCGRGAAQMARDRVEEPEAALLEAIRPSAPGSPSRAKRRDLANSPPSSWRRRSGVSAATAERRIWIHARTPAHHAAMTAADQHAGAAAAGTARFVRDAGLPMPAHRPQRTAAWPPSARSSASRRRELGRAADEQDRVRVRRFICLGGGRRALAATAAGSGASPDGRSTIAATVDRLDEALPGGSSPSARQRAHVANSTDCRRSRRASALQQLVPRRPDAMVDQVDQHVEGLGSSFAPPVAAQLEQIAIELAGGDRVTMSALRSLAGALPEQSRRYADLAGARPGYLRARPTPSCATSPSPPSSKGEALSRIGRSPEPAW